MSRAEQYSERAKEAEELSKQAKDIVAKRTYEDIARQWREMAEQAERHGW